MDRMSVSSRAGKDLVEALSTYVEGSEEVRCEEAKRLVKLHMEKRAMDMIAQRYRNLGVKGAMQLLQSLEMFEGELVSKSLDKVMAKAKPKKKVSSAAKVAVEKKEKAED